MELKMKYILDSGLNIYAAWNGIRYLGTIQYIAGNWMFIAPTIKQSIYAIELYEISEKLEQLNNV